MYKVSQYTYIKQLNDIIIAFNTYSGAIAKIDERLSDILSLSSFDVNLLNSQEKAILTQQNFIVPYGVNEYQRIIDHELKCLLENDSSLTFVIAPTLSCNFSCYYCFEPNNIHTRMNIETAQKVASFIIEHLNFNIKKLKITWFGGEPLLALDKIKHISQDLILHCKKQNIEYHSRIITNGYFLTNQTAKILSHQCFIQSAQVTLDGDEKIYEKAKGVQPGTYNRIIKNIIEASQYLSIAVRLNITEKYYDQLLKYVDSLMIYFDNYPNIKVYLAEVCDDWKCGENAHAMKSLYWNQRDLFDTYVKKHYPNRLANDIQLCCNVLKCGLIKKKNAVIGPEGELYRCEHMIGRQDEIIGSCKEGLYHNAADCKFTILDRPDKCKKCIIFPICLTGCPNDIIENKTERINCQAKIDMILHNFVREAIKKINASEINRKE